MLAACSSFLAFPSADSPSITRQMSSIYDRTMRLVWFLSSYVNRGVRYRRNSIGDIGDPCRIPVVIGSMSSVSPSNTRLTCLSLTKDFIQKVALLLSFIC